MAGLTAREAAHLLRRTGFSSPVADVNALTGKDRETAVNSIIDYESVRNQDMDEILARNFPFLRVSSSDQLTSENFNEEQIRTWWISRLLYTQRPFEEKMTLFWHNHFATAIDTVPAIHMYTQNLDLRQYALGRFDDLLLQISQGAAMLIWLNGAESSKENPNENFARELQELFTMSPVDVVTDEPNYNETDVKEIARAFAGWRFRQKNNSAFKYEWFIDTNSTDFGSKTIYNQTANFSGEDLITLLAAKRATARFLVYKLFTFFVYPLDLNLQSDKQTIDKFADVYLRRNHSIKELVRAIFQSDEFFSQRALWGVVKSPVEYVVGSLIMMKLRYPLGIVGEQGMALQSAMREMGMILFTPPNVAGWKMNLGFVNTETLLGRYNFSATLMSGFMTGLVPPDRQLERYVKPTVQKTVGKLVNQLGLELEPAVIKDLELYLTLDRAGNLAGWPTPFNPLTKIRGLIRLLMCLPEYHLN
jgi:uncharacterized protein (DUF1800 family)